MSFSLIFAKWLEVFRGQVVTSTCPLKEKRLQIAITLSLGLLFFIATFYPAADLWAMAQRPPREKLPAVALETPERLLSLQDCYKLALQQSETLAIRREEIEKTEAAFLRAFDEALGEAHFVVSELRQEPQNTTSSESSVSSSLRELRRERKFVIQQPLFQGFKSIGALGGAGSLRKQRKQEKKRVAELLFKDVVSSFFSVIEQNKDVKAIEDIRALFVERIQDLGEREKIGRSRASEVVTARARMKFIEAELAKSRGTSAIYQHVLEFLIGRPVSAKALSEEAVPSRSEPIPEENFEEIVLSRSDVEAAKHALKTARQNILIAQSGLWPEISLEHNQYEHREGFQSGIDWDLLLKVDVPLFRGGATGAKIKEAVSEWKKARHTYRQTQRTTKLEIKEAYQNWTSSADQFEALREAVHDSEENFRLQKEEYARNLVNNLDVLEALESLLEARRSANHSYYEMKRNYWNLQVALGRVRA